MACYWNNFFCQINSLALPLWELTNIKRSKRREARFEKQEARNKRQDKTERGDEKRETNEEKREK